ncbi:MAG: hypothetical protein KDJ87_21170 [Rhizobiaceae bacterium]|nr:hypothetical protein [Rhizobiaceae bacterium]
MSAAHTASAIVDAPLDFVFSQLSDPAHLGRWTLGSMDYQPSGVADVHIGTSLFDGSKSMVEIRPYRALGMIDYLVGSLEKRIPRVSIRLVAGAEWSLPEASCIAAMTTWRAAFMTDERWARTRATHELEVLLFKEQIETQWKAA